jgi:nicotinate phosphoribosyltransferase
MKRKNRFHIASPEEITAGRVTDVYFQRAQQILQQKNIDKRVRLEVTMKKRFPEGWDWGVLCGLEEVLTLVQGLPVDLWALPEGTIVHVHEPVVLIEASYQKFSVYETAVLGLLCQASGIATKAARCVQAAQGRPIYSYGVRRVHPAIAPMVERAAYIGGCAGVSSVIGAELLGIEPFGTIPHALILILEDSTTASLMFDEVIEKSVQRVVLIDTFGDEKFEALENAELLKGNIDAVRLDTPSSRRGDMLEIAREVRWELDTHGYEKIKIFISGGIDEDVIPHLNEVADAYGIGTAISNARVCDFAMDIVEVEQSDGHWEPTAKRGTRSGAKQLCFCDECGHREVYRWGREPRDCPRCLTQWEPRLKKYLEAGKLIRSLPSAEEIRAAVLEQLPKHT